ncbi:MAG: UvrB/UvrC motif-containing protein [Candidatus Omnitrophota bacterium]
MVCDICHKNIATVHLTEIVNDKIMEVHICQECARIKSDELKQQLNISEFLSGFAPVSSPDKKETDLVCSACGMNLYEFKKKGSLGCGHCYSAFKRQLTVLIKKTQGAVYHKGKIPSNIEKEIILDGKLDNLRERLTRAIQLEEFEEAARIRDQMRRVEEKSRKI